MTRTSVRTFIVRALLLAAVAATTLVASPAFAGVCTATNTTSC